VLDVGCGTGILASLLASRYGAYTGVDFSQAMVNEAQEIAAAKGLQHCEFVCTDAFDVMRDCPDAFDAIFMLDISEHVPDEEWAHIVREARHALKPGGIVYLHTPNLDFFIERLKQHGWIKQFPEHVAVRTARANMRFFKDADYGVVDCTTLPHYNVLRWLHPLTALPFVGRFFAARLWIAASR